MTTNEPIYYDPPFKVGDRVMVKSQEEFEEDYRVFHLSDGRFKADCPLDFVEGMNEYIGQVFTIKELKGAGNRDDCFVILSPEPNYGWSLSMVKRINNPGEQLTLEGVG